MHPRSLVGLFTVVPSHVLSFEHVLTQTPHAAGQASVPLKPSVPMALHLPAWLFVFIPPQPNTLLFLIASHVVLSIHDVVEPGVGEVVGLGVTEVGLEVGLKVGFAVGAAVLRLGLEVGLLVGATFGAPVGLFVGATLGAPVGGLVSLRVGPAVGLAFGASVGALSHDCSHATGQA